MVCLPEGVSTNLLHPPLPPVKRAGVQEIGGHCRGRLLQCCSCRVVARRVLKCSCRGVGDGVFVLSCHVRMGGRV